MKNSKVVFRIHKNKLFVIDKIENNLSLAQFVINRLKIEASLQSTFFIKDNLYISTFILNKFTYNQLMILREYLNDFFKDENSKSINKAIRKLKYMWFFDKFNNRNILTFTEGCIITKRLFWYDVYMVDCKNGGYSMAEKCLDNHNLKYFLYKQFKEKNSNFIFSVFKIFNYKEDVFLEVVSELKDTFYILRRIDEFNAATTFIEKIYQVNLRGSKIGKEETD